MFSALRSIRQTAVLKCDADGPLPIRYDNICAYRWIPQNDLAHTNLRAFVTHDSLHSTLEAVHYRVPAIYVSFYGDQPSNCLNNTRIGHGITLEMKDLFTGGNECKQISPSLTKLVIDVLDVLRGPHFLKSPEHLMPWYIYCMTAVGPMIFEGAFAIFLTLKCPLRTLIRIKYKEKLKKA